MTSKINVEIILKTDILKVGRKNPFFGQCLVVTQLTYGFLLTPEDQGLTPDVGKVYLALFFVH